MMGDLTTVGEPYLDDMGEFFALVGEHRKLELIRQMMYYNGCTLYDVWEQDVWDRIRIVKCFIVDRDDPATWDNDTSDAMEDDNLWPHEWDAVMVVDKGGPHTATVFQESWPKDALTEEDDE